MAIFWKVAKMIYMIKDLTYPNPPKKDFVTGIFLGVPLGLISHVIRFFSKKTLSRDLLGQEVLPKKYR